jgi:NADH-quinone oxidoreductase subunit G
MKANISVHELKPADDPDSAMSFTMEGYHGTEVPSLITNYWSPGWNSVQAINKYQIEVGGPLHGGDPGLRLIESASGSVNYFQTAPKAFIAPEKGFQMLPVYHIFGSEELSRKSPSVKERSEVACLYLNPTDATTLKVSEGDMQEVLVGNQSKSLLVKIKAELVVGLAGVSMGYCGVNPELSLVSIQK